jgi:hypothetical protein
VTRAPFFPLVSHSRRAVAHPRRNTETALAETTLAETTLAETALAETTLAETTLAETTLAETTLAETTLAETALAETTIGASLSRISYTLLQRASNAVVLPRFSVFGNQPRKIYKFTRSNAPSPEVRESQVRI